MQKNIITFNFCAQGFTDWKHTYMGDSKKSVPDSCCLFEVHGCGQNLFEITDIRVLVQKININGGFSILVNVSRRHLY